MNPQRVACTFVIIVAGIIAQLRPGANPQRVGVPDRHHGSGRLRSTKAGGEPPARPGTITGGTIWVYGAQLRPGANPQRVMPIASIS